MKKELRSYLKPSYFIILGLCSIYFGIYFFSILKQYADVSQQISPGGELSYVNQMLIPYLSSINIILLFICPLLVVRLFSEEYKASTFDLLLTSPISSWQIVWGKFMAAALSVFFVIVLASIYPLSALWIADLPLQNLFLGLFGVFLLSCVYLSISLFSSSLSSSVFLSGTISLVLCLSFWLISIFRNLDDGSQSVIISNLWIGSHLLAFLQGGVSLLNITVFLSYIFFFIFLCEQIVESLRWK